MTLVLTASKSWCLSGVTLIMTIGAFSGRVPVLYNVSIMSDTIGHLLSSVHLVFINISVPSRPEVMLSSLEFHRLSQLSIKCVVLEHIPVLSTSFTHHQYLCIGKQ